MNQIEIEDEHYRVRQCIYGCILNRCTLVGADEALNKWIQRHKELYPLLPENSPERRYTFEFIS